MLKCIRSFSLNDFSFSLAYEVMPYIQSTPSIILDSSTSAVVPTQSLISYGKFLYFGALFDEQIRTIYSPLLGTRTPAIQQISEILKKTEADRCVQYESIAILISPLGIPEKILVQLYDQVLFVFSIFLRSSPTFLLKEGLNRVKQF